MLSVPGLEQKGAGALLQLPLILKRQAVRATSCQKCHLPSPTEDGVLWIRRMVCDWFGIWLFDFVQQLAHCEWQATQQ